MSNPIRPAPRMAGFDANWEESKHPRADDGTFGPGGGGSSSQSKETKAPIRQAPVGALDIVAGRGDYQKRRDAIASRYTDATSKKATQGFLNEWRQAKEDWKKKRAEAETAAGGDKKKLKELQRAAGEEYKNKEREINGRRDAWTRERDAGIKRDIQALEKEFPEDVASQRQAINSWISGR